MSYLESNEKVRHYVYANMHYTVMEGLNANMFEDVILQFQINIENDQVKLSSCCVSMCMLFLVLVTKLSSISLWAYVL